MYNNNKHNFSPADFSTLTIISGGSIIVDVFVLVYNVSYFVRGLKKILSSIVFRESTICIASYSLHFS